ncbi:Retinoblastoma- protein 1 [Geranomyces michiganensis]|nr:Retinoblastoma- protein 1 [Geranomyces michiganensis]
MAPLIRNIREFLSTMQQLEPQIIIGVGPYLNQLHADITAAQLSYHILIDQYEMFTQVYHALISQPPADGQATDDDHIHRYDEFFSKDTETCKAWQNDHIKTWCLYCVLFVGVQLPANRRRDIRDVYWMLSQTAVPESGDWITHFKALCSLLCAKYERDAAQFAQFDAYSVDSLIDNLRANKAQPWFQYIDTPLMISPGCPWRLYQGSLELLLYSNTEDLRRKLEQQFDENYEFDPMLFRQHAMTATPLMARTGTHGPRTAPEFAVHQKLFEERLSTTFVEPNWLKASELFSDLPAHVAGTIIDHANGVCERFLAKLYAQYPQFRQRQSLGTRLFYCLIYHVTIRSPIRHTPAYPRLLRDTHFVRSMVFIAFEIIRHTWQLGNSQTTGELIRCLSPSFTTLAMMLDIVSSTDIWFSDWIKKPIVELQERTLESQIWSEPAFYKMLQLASAGAAGAEVALEETSADANISVDEMPGSSEVLELYASVRAPSVTVGQAASLALCGIHQLRNQISKMINGRLAQLCTDLNTPQSLYDRAESFVLTVLEYEHRNHLIGNRHVDLLLICCLYSAAIVERQPMTFKVIMEGYRKQPQFVVKTLTQVYLSPNQRTDLTVFYNKVFLPIMRKHITATETPLRPSSSSSLLRPPPTSTPYSHAQPPSRATFAQDPTTDPPPRLMHLKRQLHHHHAAGAAAQPWGSVGVSSQSNKLLAGWGGGGSGHDGSAHVAVGSSTITTPGGGGAGQMTPRTRRLVALDTPLTPRTLSPGSSPSSAASRRLFAAGAGAGGGAGLPPRMPTLRK